MIKAVWTLLAGAALAAQAPLSKPPLILEIETVLDDWHDAASKADEKRYFSHFAPEAVFLGTDASERWTLEEFRAYAKARFQAGTAWTIIPRQRHVSLSADRKTAWFDEAADSPKWGRCRGTGVLIKIGKSWKVAQYNFTVPIPNDLLVQVTDMIKAKR